MELQVEAAGETVGEAKWAALRELEKQQPGLDKGAVRFQVVSEGERGLLGVGHVPARVIATVSTDEKAKLAHAAGADHVVNYRSEDAAEKIRGIAPTGVDVVVEVAPTANAALDEAVLAPGGTVAVYATDDGEELELLIGALMDRNARYQFVLVYTVPEAVKDQAVADVTAAAANGALPVGADAGLPLHRFPLEDAAAAHAAVEGSAVGKVLIDVSS